MGLNPDIPGKKKKNSSPFTIEITKHNRSGFKILSKTLRKRKWQPTPAFLPEKSHRQKSLLGYSSQRLKSQTELSEKTTMTTKRHSVEMLRSV